MDWWRILKIYAGPAEEDADPSSYPPHDHSWEIVEADEHNWPYSNSGVAVSVRIKCGICGEEALGRLDILG